MPTVNAANNNAANSGPTVLRISEPRTDPGDSLADGVDDSRYHKRQDRVDTDKLSDDVRTAKQVTGAMIRALSDANRKEREFNAIGLVLMSLEAYVCTGSGNSAA